MFTIPVFRDFFHQWLHNDAVQYTGRGWNHAPELVLDLMLAPYVEPMHLHTVASKADQKNSLVSGTP